MGLLRRGGPAPRWRARSLEAGSCGCVLSTRVRPHAGKWGGGRSTSFPARHAPCAHARAELGTRAAGRNGAPRHRARRLARARPASTARYVRTTGHGARARCSSRPHDRRFQPTPSVVAHLRCGQIDHKFPLLSSRKTFLTTSLRVRGQYHARTSGSLLSHFPLSNRGGSRQWEIGVRATTAAGGCSRATAVF